MELESMKNDSDVASESSSMIESEESEVRSSKKNERGNWGNRAEFLLAIIGFTVGIGSIWRFPILCARNGGGAFIIPFLFFMLLCGWPLYYIEVCLGQFTGKSAGAAFEFCPLFKGIGFLMVLISFNILWYYVTIMGWVQYYFIQSFFDPLPWTTCDNWWNTENCREYTVYDKTTTTVSTSGNNTLNATLQSDFTNGTSLVDYTIANLNSSAGNKSLWVSSAQEFWTNNVLRQSDGLENMGSIQLHLVITNFVAWFIVVIALVKGVKSLGKVVYITATAPYILLTILLIRGLTLDGAVDGIVWYLTPDFEKLASPQVWQQAAVQVFYSLGPTYGGAITMASHNKFHQKSIVETTICVVADAFTALYGGLVVFACLGFMAKEAGTTVDEVAKSASGPGLAFIAYPEAINRMPLPQLWAVLFFFTLVTVAFDSAFGFLETVTDTILDIYSKQLRRYEYVVRFGTTFLLFLLGLPFCMNGGIYLFELADWYVLTYALLFGSSLEAFMVCWIYGADRFAKDIELMMGRKVSKFVRICWCIFMTGFLTVTFFIILFSYASPNYGGSYVYKPYAITIGILLALIPFVPVFGMMFWQLYKTEGTLIERIKYLVQPSSLWEPVDEKAQKIYRSNPYVYKETFLERVRLNLLGDETTPWI